MIPTLETERLTLRAHTVEDLAEYVALWADPEVVRFVGGRPFTHEETWARLLRNRGHWDVLGFGYWLMHERATGRFVGEVGFADFHREIVPSLDGAPEAGWVLSPWAFGRGLATEAVRAIVAWGDAHWDARRTVCIIDPGNRASIRVAEKCGYSEQVRTTYKGSPTILFQRAISS
jgi:RimJ/RimL family protein N-acetyltransferase